MDIWICILGEILEFIFIQLLDVSLSKMSCLNPIVRTLLKGTRLNLVHVAIAHECGCLRMKLAEATDRSRCLRVTDMSRFFLNLLATWARTSLSLIFSDGGPLLAVHTGVMDCLIASIWRKPYLLQCDVHWTLSLWRVLKQLKNLKEPAKNVKTVPGSWAGPAHLKSKLLQSPIFLEAGDIQCSPDYGCWIDIEQSDAVLWGMYYLWKL